MRDYYSRFGGLWIDDRDPKNVEARIERIADADLRQNIRNFVRDGYVILPGAVPAEAIDAYLQEYESAADTPGFLCLFGDTFSREKASKPGAKVCDTVMLLSSGPDLSFSPRIGQFLEEVFEDKALAFQSLHFEMGSTQGIHQDTAYVVVEREPTKLIASWIALEDIEPGTGELVYYVGGHRITEYRYGGEYKHYDPARDEIQSHTAHINHLHEEAARLGLPLGKFSAKKGDVLLWHADLPHGGGEITKPGRTRRSLVTHYCPKTLTPHLWRYISEEWRRKAEARDGHAFTSVYFPPPEHRKSKAIRKEEAGSVLQPSLEVRYPSQQNAIDLFGDRWFTRIEEVYPGVTSGPHNFLKGDARPVLAAQHLGYVPGSLHNMEVCELGPMEGMHTYQLSNLGAKSIISVESNAQSYMRCLVLKEILQHRGRFLLGDALKYLQNNATRYDLIFCSGILYHMSNPYELIKAMAQRTDRIFLSTHYFDPELPKGPTFEPKTVDCDGMPVTFYEHAYNVDINSQSFWGGNQPTACWLSKETIQKLFSHFGFSLTIQSDVREWDAGLHLNATARRP